MMIPLLIVCLLLLLPIASACGGFFCELNAPVVQSGEAIVFGVQGTKITMHVQILYEGPAEGFSWVLPVPFQPIVAVGSDQIFSAMFSQTLPGFQLDIQMKETETCAQDDLFPQTACSVSEGAAADPTGAVVLEEGSVGPYEFTVLEAADNDPSSVFRWLETNGYDQPDESAALLNYYALADHVFVALRLRKEAKVGEIQPLILEYEMPPADDPTRTAIACVPIQLTRIAATPQMPITVYVLGDARAIPLNYMELQLDDTKVDWVGCLNGGPSCYDADYRDRFDRAAMELANQHAFVTEYAGTARVMDEAVVLPLTQEQIANVQTPQEFLDTLSFLLPDIPLVDSILNDYLGDNNFSATALAEELHEKVLQPAMDDQAYVDGFEYLTRLYARLSPERMDKDPFFAFRPELGDVDNLHRATALPICANGQPSALEITVDNNSKDTVIVPAGFGGCGGWVPFNPVVPVNETMKISHALQVASYGFSGDEGVIVSRLEDGTFDMEQVEEAVRFGDSLVMSQEIPEYNKTQAPSLLDETPTMTPSIAMEESTMLPSTLEEAPTVLPSNEQPSTTMNEDPTMGPSTETVETITPTILPTTEPTSGNILSTTIAPSSATNISEGAPTSEPNADATTTSSTANPMNSTTPGPSLTNVTTETPTASTETPISLSPSSAPTAEVKSSSPPLFQSERVFIPCIGLLVWLPVF